LVSSNKKAPEGFIVTARILTTVMTFSEDESVPEKAANAGGGTLVQNDWDLLHASPEKEAFLRDMLVRLADKWTLSVIECLDVNGEMRFTRLQESVGGVSQKMLTKTLRQLERDGLVTRNVHASIPPRVDYKLTPLGESFSESICGVCTWAGQNMQSVAAARRDFDGKK
jgi:DNA-binding HxlR family transcriptional regulator